MTNKPMLTGLKCRLKGLKKTILWAGEGEKNFCRNAHFAIYLFRLFSFSCLFFLQAFHG
jgi:hypothetical protein